MSDKKQEQELRKLIDQELQICCEHSLPALKKLVKDESGREYAEDYIFKVCAADGVSVHTAMLNLESEL